MASGYRLVYEVIDDEICVFVIAVGKKTRIKFTNKLRKEMTSKNIKMKKHDFVKIPYPI